MQLMEKNATGGKISQILQQFRKLDEWMEGWKIGPIFQPSILINKIPISGFMARQNPNIGKIEKNINNIPEN